MSDDMSEFESMQAGANEYDEDISFDFSEALDSGPVPPGDYLVTVSAKPQRQISKAGNPMVKWEFMISEGKQTGRKVFAYTAIKGPGSGRARDILRGLGFTEEAEGKKPFKPAAAIGAQALVTVQMQKGSDEYTEIKRIKPAGNGSVESTALDEGF